MTIPAKGVITGVSSRNTNHWRGLIHQFLNVSEDIEEHGKVLVCHNGQTISIAEEALTVHLAHGDTQGVCPN